MGYLSARQKKKKQQTLRMNNKYNDNDDYCYVSFFPYFFFSLARNNVLRTQ